MWQLVNYDVHVPAVGSAAIISNISTSSNASGPCNRVTSTWRLSLACAHVYNVSSNSKFSAGFAKHTYSRHRKLDFLDVSQNAQELVASR